MQGKCLAYALSRYLRLGRHFIGWGVNQMRYFPKNNLFKPLFIRQNHGTWRPIDPLASDARRKDRIADMAQGGNEALRTALESVEIRLLPTLGLYTSSPGINHFHTHEIILSRRPGF
jgi:hypothetical protein